MHQCTRWYRFFDLLGLLLERGQLLDEALLDEELLELARLVHWGLGYVNDR